MLAPGKVLEVQKLLAEGRLSQRKIAKALGVSRATVSAIASGKRPDYAARQRARADEAFEPLGPIERCPTGAIVWIDDEAGVVKGAASKKIVRHSALPEAPT